MRNGCGTVNCGSLHATFLALGGADSRCGAWRFLGLAPRRVVSGASTSVSESSLSSPGGKSHTEPRFGGDHSFSALQP